MEGLRGIIILKIMFNFVSMADDQDTVRLYNLPALLHELGIKPDSEGNFAFGDRKFCIDFDVASEKFGRKEGIGEERVEERKDDGRWLSVDYRK